ncbi:VanZ family protein [Pleionea litopenaei]|uniref:VanZ family protein n=1 Tax=Pleionea litopenaei TaxID=3070815 RepID=A0AA51X5U8_9GAMM|nr:VanZ family protein [Pleionea sp. HL-JVS1]WMS86423.1 VanZ family protein [Pleionea sp. HL-JVS1]
MRRMLAVVALVIGYGSLYPFNFHFELAMNNDWWHWLFDVSAATSRGDVLGNVLLFIPLGFIAAFGWHDRSLAEHRTWRFGLLLAACVYALVLQMAQVMLPSRVASMSDTWANLLGIAIGALAFKIIASQKMATWMQSDRVIAERAIPAFLVCCWLGYLWFPFIPSLRWEQIVYSFRPLTHWHLLSPFNWLDDWVFWSLFWWLLARMLPRSPSMWQQVGMVIAIMLVQAVLVRNIMTLSHVLAALVSIATLPVIARFKDHQLAIFLLCWWLLRVWYPFHLQPTSGHFSWIPFSGFLTGSHWINSFVIFESVFILGAIAYCLRHGFTQWQFGWNKYVIPLVATAWILMVEVGQIWFGDKRFSVSSSFIFALLYFSFDRLKHSAEMISPTVTIEQKLDQET